jgi:flavin reductase (DIM6/NTAB) family NADH-FMN oxidoreductase RutF
MAKTELNPTTALMPVPTVLVTTCDKEQDNIITLAWVGTVCSTPPLIGISIRPSRYSHGLLEECKEFAVNIPSEDLLTKTDRAGILSGRDINKFTQIGLTPLKSSKIKPPLIKECPVNLECKLVQKISLGSHDLFIGEILTTHADDNVISDNKIDVSRVRPIAYCVHEYWSLKEKIGTYGFSAKK